MTAGPDWVAEELAKLRADLNRIEAIVTLRHEARITSLEEAWKEMSSELRRMSTWIGQLADASTVASITMQKIDRNLDALTKLLAARMP
jgi:hypothetical protein